MEPFESGSGPRVWIRKQIQFSLQKMSLTADLFLKNELIYHAAATAFFFLLSITPLFLLILLTFNKYIGALPNLADSLFTFLKSLNSNIDKDFFIRIGLIHSDVKVAKTIGLINLLWAGLWILTAIQKGLGTVFKSSKTRTTLVMNVLSLVGLTILLGLALLAAAISFGFNFFLALASNYPFFQKIISVVLPTFQSLLPFLSTFFLIFLFYRFVPGTRPTTLSSLRGAFLCALAIVTLHFFLARFLSVARFNVIYGVLGSLILMLLWVHFTFILFFFFAEYIYVCDNIDFLIISRMHFHRSSLNTQKRKIERFLFKHPQKVFEKYARNLRAGEIVFEEGDDTTDIFYAYYGIIGIYRNFRENRQKLTEIQSGELFGEMAYLLKEKRMFTAISETPSTILLIPGDIFEALLQVDQTFSRDVIQQLSNRLMKAHQL